MLRHVTRPRCHQIRAAPTGTKFILKSYLLIQIYQNCNFPHLQCRTGITTKLIFYWKPTVHGHGRVLRQLHHWQTPGKVQKFKCCCLNSLSPLHSGALSGILAGVIGFLQAPLSAVLDCLYLLSHNGSKVFLNSYFWFHTIFR